MRGFVLSPLAQVDLGEIWNYTTQRWGQDQAEDYVRAIAEICRELAAAKRPSRRVNVREGYRKVAIGSHVVFFKTLDAGQIVIIRVLHRRMDPDRHL